jgi:hypothetical protein
MASISLGGRDLKVKRPSVGFWDRCIRYETESNGMTLGEFVNGAADLIFESVQDNEGVTREWVREQLPFPSPVAEWRSLMLACGFIVESKEPSPGEATTQ